MPRESRPGRAPGHSLSPRRILRAHPRPRGYMRAKASRETLLAHWVALWPSGSPSTVLSASRQFPDTSPPPEFIAARNASCNMLAAASAWRVGQAFLRVIKPVFGIPAPTPIFSFPRYPCWPFVTVFFVRVYASSPAGGGISEKIRPKIAPNDSLEGFPTRTCIFRARESAKYSWVLGKTQGGIQSPAGGTPRRAFRTGGSPRPLGAALISRIPETRTRRP